MANRYNCLVILSEGTKDITIIADTVNPDSTCATRFHKKVKVIGLYGTPETAFEIVAQYPTDRLIIESVDYNITENDL
jgi:hypothetical protein